MLHAYQLITKMILLGLSKMLTLRVLNLGNYESYDETLVTIRPAFGDYINYGIILLYIKIFFLRGNYVTNSTVQTLFPRPSSTLCMEKC